MAPMAWKIDRALYDRDRWMASTGRCFHALPNGGVAIRVHGSNEQSWLNDIYSLETEELTFRSADRGFSWERVDEGSVPADDETWLDADTVVTVISGGGRTQEEKRQTLADVGGNPDTVSRGGYELWPEGMRPELERRGLYINESMPGIVGTLSQLQVGRSTDGGRSFAYRSLTELPQLARTSGTFRRCIEISDGTLLGPCMGRRTPDAGEFAYAVRSTDRGESWSFHVIAEDESGQHEWPETDLMEMSSGRVLAMHRHHRHGSAVGDYLWQNFSDDGGVTWSSPEQTPIWGYPPQLLELASGTVLVTYAHRRHPYGVRACLSHDGGNSWQIEQEKVIRDDSLPGLVWYPCTIQLDDATLLTAYSMSKIPRVPYRPDDEITASGDLLIHARKRVGVHRYWWGGYHGFAAVSRFTEDYVRADAQLTSTTMYEDADRQTPTGGGQGRAGVTGHDEE